MKQHFAFLLIFALLSCGEGKKIDIQSTDLRDSIPQIELEIDSQPIFLNLNPEMNDVKFEKNLKNSAPNRTFSIPINKYTFAFNISKSSKRIILKYDEVKILKFLPKKGENAETRYLNFIKKDPVEEDIINEFIDLFRKKYSNEIKELPIIKNQRGEYYNQPMGRDIRTLSYYGFIEENYLIFQDSLRTVIIGYSSTDYPQTLDKAALESITFQKENSNIVSSYEQSFKSNDLYSMVVEYKIELEKLSPYEQALKSTSLEEQITRKKGISLEINYMINSDFELIRTKTIAVNKDFNQKLREKERLQIIKQQSAKINLDEI